MERMVLLKYEKLIKSSNKNLTRYTHTHTRPENDFVGPSK